jgi:ketosteroid isomerase-like protein
MEGDAEGINGEYDNKYVFVYKFKDGKILSIVEYNSDLLVATRLYKNKLVPSD